MTFSKMHSDKVDNHVKFSLIGGPAHDKVSTGTSLWQPIISGLYLNYPGLVAWDMTQANALTVIQDPVEDVVQRGLSCDVIVMFCRCK